VGYIIRGNRFDDCGICSLQGLGLFGGLIEGNTSFGCGWQRVLRLRETGGIKLHYKKHIVVGARGTQGGICLEATYLPVMPKGDNTSDYNVIVCPML